MNQVHIDRILGYIIVLRSLILQLEKGESVLEALARLGKGQTKVKKIPRWKFKRNKGDDGTDVDAEKPAEDPAQVKIKDGKQNHERGTVE
ncbi:hypothetical protein ACLOAV_005880 [Pseudogymnoascus australis]